MYLTCRGGQLTCLYSHDSRIRRCRRAPACGVWHVGKRTGGAGAFGGSHAPIPVRLTCTVGLHVRCHVRAGTDIAVYVGMASRHLSCGYRPPCAVPPIIPLPGIFACRYVPCRCGVGCDTMGHVPWLCLLGNFQNWGHCRDAISGNVAAFLLRSLRRRVSRFHELA